MSPARSLARAKGASPEDLGEATSNGMRIFIKAKPGAREEKVEKVDEVNFVVSVKEPPIKGRANMAIIKALAEYFKVAVGRVKIVSGWTSKQKTIEII